MLVPRRRLRRGVRRRGKNGKDRRSFGFAQAFGRGRGFAQPWCLSELTRTDPNACTISTSWGSLVRAQYRPLKSPARAFLLLLLGPESDKSVEQYESIARRVEVPGFDGVSVFHDLFHQPAIFPLLAMAHVTERVRLCPAAPKPDDAPSGRDRPPTARGSSSARSPLLNEGGGEARSRCGGGAHASRGRWPARRDP
jgi:hypothetical protein